MDGDRYLIKLVKNRPALWRKTSKYTKEDKKAAWAEIAAKIGTDVDWIKSRWYRLQERFLNALISDDTKMQVKFKYFQQMRFLAPSSYHSGKNTQCQTPEFSITLQDLQANDDDDDKVNVFELIVSGTDVIDRETKTIVEYENQSTDITEELIDEESVSPNPVNIAYPNIEKQNSPKELEVIHEMEPDSVEVHVEVPLNEDEEEPAEENLEAPVEENVDEPMKEVVEDFKPSIENIENSQHVKVKVEKEPDMVSIPCQSTEITMKPVEIKSQDERSEDNIFGELVAAMLKAMPETRKKQVKREIMCILLS